MAVTVADVALDLRLIAAADAAVPAGQAAIIGRHLATAQNIVTRRAPSAPEALQDGAVIAVAAYLYDRPTAASGNRFGAVFQNCGAAAILAGYLTPGARPIGAASGPDATPAGGPGVDNTARAEAEAASAAAATAQRTADANTGFLATFVERVTAVIQAVVPAWALAPNPPSGGGSGDLPAIPADGETYTLQGRDPAGQAAAFKFWERPNYVPDTPGTAAGVGHVLTVTGENDRDYAFRAPAGGSGVDATARAAAARNAGDIAENSATIATARTSLAALEDALPDPPIPAAAVAATSYKLRLPASGSASERAQWVVDNEFGELAGRIVAEQRARTAADTALGVRIDGLAGFAAPVFDPDYWVKTGDARSILVHLDPRADAVAGLAKIRLTVQGVTKTVARTANQDVYAFALTAADAANITRAAGNAGSDTVRADVTLLGAGDAELQDWRGLLRVLDAAPSAGGVAIPDAQVDDPGNYRLRARDLNKFLLRNVGDQADHSFYLPLDPFGAPGDRIQIAAVSRGSGTLSFVRALVTGRETPEQKVIDGAVIVDGTARAGNVAGLKVLKAGERGAWTLIRDAGGWKLYDGIWQ